MSEKNDAPKLFLLDAYSLIFRAYYAFIKNPRFNSEGMNTSAILGFTNSLHEILSKEKPDYIAVVFDPSGPTFRNELYPEYKANRDETPEDIKKSVPYIKEIIEAFKIPVLEAEGFEADDLIGTLAKKAEKAGFVSYMMTPDKDYLQLLSDKIFMYKPARGGKKAEIFDTRKLKKKYGIENPELFIDILALWGDTSDNIPGVKGIGEKTASKLINRFGSIDGIYENIGKLKGKQKENLIAGKEQLEKSKVLVTIRQDVPAEFEPEKLKIETPDYEKLKTLFAKLDFRALSKRIIPENNEGVQTTLFGDIVPNSGSENNEDSGNYKTIKNSEHDYRLLKTDEEIDDLAEKLSKQKAFCFDTETDALNPLDAELVGVAFSFKEAEAYYLPVSKQSDLKQLDKFKKVLENPEITKIGQNIKYDILVLQNYGINLRGKIFDTMLAHYLLEPDKRHSMDYISETYLNYRPVSIENLIGKKGKKQMSMRQISVDKVSEYAGEDADITFRLYKVLSEKLKENNLTKLAEDIEFPLVYVLAETERNGVKIDKEALAEYEKELILKIQEIEADIYKHAGTHFNIASPKQLGIILFEKLKITDKPKLTKTKQYSTSEQELQKLTGTHPIIKLVLDYRGLSKLLSTYVKALPDLINAKTGLIHTSYNQAVTTTGRLSSTNPNLQNIPIRTPEGRRIRKAFVPRDKNRKLIAADYSQIELRLMAQLSGDENMLKAFRDGEDIHTATAAKVFDISPENVSKEMRAQAKSANFGIIYGISAYGLAQNVGISVQDAKKIINGYFKSYPKVKEYMDAAMKKGREQEHVSTIFGRKRFLRNINSRNRTVRGNDERNAINAPIQGSAADIIKIAMIKLHDRLNKEFPDAKMILQVHDELVFDVPEKNIEKLREIIVEEMEHAADLNVELTVEARAADNWLDAH